MHGGPRPSNLAGARCSEYHQRAAPARPAGADAVLGSVSGTKLDGYQLRMTVSIRPRGETQLIVRANAQYNITPVEDPEPYQQFFTALQKSLFLTAHSVD